MTIDEMRQTLEKQFSPIFLKITDKSYTHVGHPEEMATREMLLDLVIASGNFEGKRLLERHAAIYAALGVGKTAEIHGLTIRAYSPEEWEKSSGPS